jgi:predicted pyridoxine 5'-phosphate oxidase superfamily flavin-nucleotide-binding protein
MLPAPRQPAQPLSISPEWKTIIDGALVNGTPVIVGYVDAAGVPHLSPRGSVQVLDEERMALWARDPEGGILKGIASNPNVTLFYRDPKTRTSFTITGKAHIASDDQTRDAIYDNQPVQERNFDGRKRGTAIVVDVEELEAATPAGRSRMARTQRS